MKAQRSSTLEEVLLFSRGRTIYALENDSNIFPIVQRPRYVTSLTLHNGKVIDSGNYDGIYDTVSGELLTPFLHSQSFRNIASSRGRLFGLQRNGEFRDVLNPNSTPNLDLDEIQGISGGNRLTYWGEINIQTNPSMSDSVSNHTSLRDFNPFDDSTSVIYEGIKHPGNEYTKYEGYFTACESEDGRRFVVQQSGEVFLDEGDRLGKMPRIGLPKNLELLIFKRGMRICREHISGRLRNDYGLDWSTYDDKKKEGWELFLERVYHKYKDVFPNHVWQIQDNTGNWPHKKTPKIKFLPLTYNDAYQYFESNLGDDCRRHAEFQRSQSNGFTQGAAIDYAVEAVLGNMIEYAISKHSPNSIAHLNDSIYLGTQSGRIVKMNDEIDQRSFGWHDSFKTYHNGIGALRQNPNGAYWANGLNYFYPIGWAQGVDIELPTKSQRKLPITAMVTIPREIYEGTGLQQRVNDLRRNRHYFANGGKQEMGEVIPIRRVA